MYVSSNSLEGALANAFGDNFLDDSCRPAWKTDAKTQSFPKKKQWCAELFWIVLQKSFLKQTFVFSEAIAAWQCRNKWFLWVIPTNKHWAVFFYGSPFGIYSDVLSDIWCGIYSNFLVWHFLWHSIWHNFGWTNGHSICRYSDILSYTDSDMLSKVLPDICLDTNFDIIFYLIFNWTF